MSYDTDLDIFRLLTPDFCRAARGMFGWSQEDLEKQSGVSKKTIADFELGQRKPYKRTLVDLGRAFSTHSKEKGVDFYISRDGTLSFVLIPTEYAAEYWQKKQDAHDLDINEVSDPALLAKVHLDALRQFHKKYEVGVSLGDFLTAVLESVGIEDLQRTILDMVPEKHKHLFEDPD